jgi:bifunctional non-homologous end joining protein LigD
MKGFVFCAAKCRCAKGKNPQNKGANMQTERAELYFQQGSSDKVYHLQLENVQDQWSVQAQWGRRGSALQSDVKVSNTSYEEAKRVYDRVLREKTGKGYQIAQATANGNEAIAVGLPATKEHSGHTPELLTPIEEPEALILAKDAAWWFQQKFDGRRLAVQKSEGKYSGINKLGQIIPIDSRLAESIDRVQAQGFLADGEITDSRFYIWDLLSVNDTDLRIQPYEIRYVHLTQHFRGVSDVLRVCETAMTTKAKRDFVKKMHGTNAEGFVCKNRNAAYAGGRAGQHFKCKFVATASFIVGPKPDKKADDGHRSIAVYLLDGNQPRFMGTVGVPDRYPLPRVEQIVEVRYLYCHPGPEGKLIQAKYFGKVRDDVAVADCCVSQLKVKAGDSESTVS